MTSVGDRESEVLQRIEAFRRRRPRLTDEVVTSAHGAGGKASAALVDAVFVEAFSGGQSNVVVVPSIYDREENTVVVQGDFSPPISSQPNSLPFEVNVISFLTQTSAGDPSGVLGSFLRPNIVPFAQYGWLKLDLTSGDNGHQLPGGVTPAGADVTFNGLPTTGYMAWNVINTQAQPGMLANYGGLFRHRASRSCVGTDPACS